MWIVLAVVLAGLGTVLILLKQSKTVADSHAFYQIDAGFETEYSEHSLLRIAGVLEINVKGDGDGAHLFFRIAEPTLTFDGASDNPTLRETVEAELKQGWQARFLPSRQFDGLYLSEQVPANLQEILWDLSFAFSTPEPGQKQIELNYEAPGKKIHETLKRSDEKGHKIDRTVNSIQDILTSNSSMAFQASTWEINESLGYCSYARSQDFLPVECSQKLAVTLRQGGERKLTGRKIISLKKIDSKVAPVTAATIPTRQPQLDLSPAQQKQRLKIRLAMNNSKNMVFADEIQSFKEKAESNEEWEVGPRMGWTEKMADYLLLHPEAIPELLNLAREIGPQNRLFSLLPHTLSTCGSADAQAALIELAKAYEDQPQAMLPIVSSMLFLESANNSSVENLTSLHKKGITQTSDIALLALGKFGNQDSEPGKRSFEYVRNELQEAKTDEQRLLAISALGNGGREDNIELIAPLLKAENPEIRRRAVDALRFVSSESRYGLILQALADRDDSVRRAAGAALQYQPLAIEVVPELLKAVHFEKVIGVRIEIYKTLVKSAQSIPNFASVLNSIREKETNSELQAYLDRELSRLH
jgi:HEAT repeat protein